MFKNRVYNGRKSQKRSGFLSKILARIHNKQGTLLEFNKTYRFKSIRWKEKKIMQWWNLQLLKE